MTICARDFEIHVDLFVEAGAEARGDALEAALAEANERYLFSRDERTTAALVLDLLRARGLDARDGRVVHRRARRRAAHGTCRAPATSSSVRSSRTRTRSRPRSSAFPEDVLAAHGAVSERGRRRHGARRPRAPRSRCRGRGDRGRRAGRRHGGKAGRPRATCTPPGRRASSPGASTSRATGRRSASVRRWRRCTSCADLSHSRDRHGTALRLTWQAMNAIRLFCALQLPPAAVDELVAWQFEHLAWQVEHLRAAAQARPAGEPARHARLPRLAARGRGAGDRRGARRCRSRGEPGGAAAPALPGDAQRGDDRLRGSLGRRDGTGGSGRRAPRAARRALAGSAGRGCRTSRFCVSRSRQDSLRQWRTYVRSVPSALRSTLRRCDPVGRSTRHLKRQP